MESSGESPRPMPGPFSSRARRWLWAASVAVVSGCGPVQSTSYLIDAETMLEAARTAQADKLAPYEWTSAQLYFEKSKEEVGDADFEQAVDYGKKAVEFATRARDTALKVGRRNEAVVPVEPADPVTP